LHKGDHVAIIPTTMTQPKEKTLVLEQQALLVEGETGGDAIEQDVWVVAATRNTLEWKVGDELVEEEVKDIITRNDTNVEVA
jgi:hypothetical protein